MNLHYCCQVWLTFNYRYMLNFNIHTIFIRLVKDLLLILTRRIAEHLYFRLFATRYIHLLLTFFLFFLPTKVLETRGFFRNVQFYGAVITLLLQLVFISYTLVLLCFVSPLYIGPTLSDTWFLFVSFVKRNLYFV